MACVNALKASVSVPSEKIKVTVRNGWVKLEGEVEWQYQKEAAESAVRYLPGMMGVSNLITVKPRVSPTGLTSKIEGRLQAPRRTGRPPHQCRGGRRQADPARLRALVG